MLSWVRLAVEVKLIVRRSLGLVGCALAIVVARPALAADGGVPDGGLSPADVIAVYCSESDVECTTAPLQYEKTISLPIAFDWDTGWIPQGSSLQVRFYVKLPATTTVKLDGWLETTWPDPMTLATPGGRGGLLAFDYGLEVGAKAKIDVSVLGIPVKWTGDIPYVPQIDFHIKSAKSFVSWAFAPDPVTTSAFTAPLRLFEVNLLGLTGIPSQISKGGVALDVKGELAATYETLRIQIEPAADGEQPITSQDGTTLRAFPGGAFVEYDVWPEGKVDYTGTLHLLPTFFVEILGKDFSIPLYDFPVSIDLGDQSFIFDPVRVHVPLPDLLAVQPVLDFGQVTIGDGKKLSIALSNIGEAKARAAGFIDASMADTFKLLTPQVFVGSMDTNDANIRFQPTSAGTFETKLTLVTNDPDGRFQYVTLRGVGVPQGDPDYPDGGGGSGAGGPGAQSGDTGGCGCRVAGERGSSGAIGAAAGALALALARRRRRGLIRTGETG
jgi:MYXO-CTERM domain-containing protein